jgi:hypothetical protein
MRSTEDRLRASLSATADSVQASHDAWAHNAALVRRDRRGRRVLPAGLAVVALAAGIGVWRIPDWHHGQASIVIGAAPTASPSASPSATGTYEACSKSSEMTTGYEADGPDMSLSVSLSLADARHDSLLCYRITSYSKSGIATAEGALERSPMMVGGPLNVFPYLTTVEIGDTLWLVGAAEAATVRLEATYSDGERGETNYLDLGTLHGVVLRMSPDSDGRQPVKLTAIGADGEVLQEVGLATDSRGTG